MSNSTNPANGQGYPQNQPQFDPQPNSTTTTVVRRADPGQIQGDTISVLMNTVKSLVDTTQHSKKVQHVERLQAIAQLNTPVAPENILSRAGPGGQRVSYVEGSYVLNAANKVFKFDGWMSQIVHMSEDFFDWDGAKFTTGILCIVRVVHRSGAFREDVGYGTATGKTKAEVLEKARKGAVTDSMKRCLRQFGPYFGNSVHGKNSVITQDDETVSDPAFTTPGAQSGISFEELTAFKAQIETTVKQFETKLESISTATGSNMKMNDGDLREELKHVQHELALEKQRADKAESRSVSLQQQVDSILEEMTQFKKIMTGIKAQIEEQDQIVSLGQNFQNGHQSVSSTSAQQRLPASPDLDKQRQKQLEFRQQQLKERELESHTIIDPARKPRQQQQQQQQVPIHSKDLTRGYLPNHSPNSNAINSKANMSDSDFDNMGASNFDHHRDLEASSVATTIPITDQSNQKRDLANPNHNLNFHQNHPVRSIGNSSATSTPLKAPPQRPAPQVPQAPLPLSPHKHIQQQSPPPPQPQPQPQPQAPPQTQAPTVQTNHGQGMYGRRRQAPPQQQPQQQQQVQQPQPQQPQQPRPPQPPQPPPCDDGSNSDPDNFLA